MHSQVPCFDVSSWQYAEGPHLLFESPGRDPWPGSRPPKALVDADWGSGHG